MHTLPPCARTSWFSSVHSSRWGSAVAAVGLESGSSTMYTSVGGGLDDCQCGGAAQVCLAVGLPSGRLPRRLLALGGGRRGGRLKRQLRLHSGVGECGAQAADDALGAVAGIWRVVCERGSGGQATV